MSKLQAIKDVVTLEDLQELGIGEVIYEVGGRGGNLGFSGYDVAEYLDVDSDYLPGKYGVYCNYLGGGIRGAIASSGYSSEIAEDKAELLDALGEACKKVYLFIENGLNDEYYEDGEPNWDAQATAAARAGGTVSAY